MVEYQLAIVGGNDFYNHLMDLKDGKTERQQLKQVLKEMYGRYFTDDRVYEIYLDFVEYYMPRLMDYCRRAVQALYSMYEEVFASLSNIANRLVEPFRKLSEAFSQIVSVEVDDISFENSCVRTARVKTVKNSYYMSACYSANLNYAMTQSKRHYQYCRRNF